MSSSTAVWLLPQSVVIMLHHDYYCDTDYFEWFQMCRRTVAHSLILADTLQPTNSHNSEFIYEV